MLKYIEPVKGLSKYEVYRDGVLIGKVRNTFSFGWVAEDLNGQKSIKNTRKSAVEEMIKYMK